MRSVVVFPAPLGPRKPVTELGSTVKDRLSTARTEPKDLDSPFTSTRMGAKRGAVPLEMAHSWTSGRRIASIQAHRGDIPAHPGTARRRQPGLTSGTRCWLARGGRDGAA